MAETVDAGQQAFKFSGSVPAMADVIVSYQSMASSIENPSRGTSESYFKNDTNSSSTSSFFSAYPAASSSSSSLSSGAFSSPESSLCSGSPHSVMTSASSHSALKRQSPLKCDMNNEKIKVLVRMRPFLEEEKICPSRQVVCLLGNKILVKEHVSFQKGRQSSCRSFNQLELEVDYVQDDSYVQVNKIDKKEDAQRQMFDTVGAPAVENVLHGQNVTILSYGQAGTGKSYTIYGDGTPEGNGLLPRMACELLQQVKRRNLDKECRVEVSFLEIYQEKLRDLLVSVHANADLGRVQSPNSSIDSYDYPSAGRHEEDMRSILTDSETVTSFSSETMMDSNYLPGNKARLKTSHQASAFCAGGPLKPSEDYLKVREQPVIGTYVEGLLWIKVSCPSEMDRLFKYGMTNRSTISKDLNSHSSGSHTRFTMRITRFRTAGPNGHAVSYLNLIDLAGSEKLQNVSIERQNEMKYINKSLSQLNSVILSLSKNKFVSFRNSALTWLLKDSLGGNCSTILVANVSPAEKDFNETLSTLKYALKAKRIQTSNHQSKELK